MNKVSRLFLATAASAALGLSALHTHATPVSVSDFSFALGSGYGVDANENSGTRLDVLFSGSSFSAQSFTLGAVGDFRTLALGTVQFREENAHSGILASETDGLDVAANLTFVDPFATVVQMLVTGSATIGSVSDAAIDFTIDWNPVQMAFGSGGLLEIALNDLNFTGMQTLTQSATITLLRTSEVTRVEQIPEPGTLVLAGLALGAVGFVRRSRGN
jgi:hypothetical protein